MVEEQKQFKTVGIEVHPEYFHLTLLETNPSEILEVANGVLGRFEGLAKTRRQDRAIHWLPSEPERPAAPETVPTRHYRPRVYFTTGTFDLGVLFLTPTLEMASWLQDHRTLVAGHDSNICLLPRAEKLFDAEERKKYEFDPADRDFNRDFITSFDRPANLNHSGDVSDEEARDSEIEAQPAELRFVSITKLKFNPVVTWATPKQPVEQETGRIREAFQRLWMEVDRWRGEISAEGDEARVALGMSFGWNEALVVAHASSPERLLRLVLAIRQISTWTEVQDRQETRGPDGKNTGHLALTTLTSFGFDIELRQAALEALRGRVRLLDGEVGGPDRRIDAKNLVELAQGIEKDRGAVPEAEEIGDTGASGRTGAQGLFVQIGCCAYPGHEIDLLELLFELEQDLVSEKVLAEGDRGRACIDVGKRDVWTPYLPMSSKGLGPVGMATLVSLIQLWLRNSGTEPVPAEHPKLIPAAFDFYTRLGWIPRFDDDPSLSPAQRAKVYGELLRAGELTPLPAGHVLGLPRFLLTPGRVGSFLQMLPQSSPDGGDKSFLDSLRRSMRILQLPYPLSEQILNVINIFCWAQNREVIWDESVELISPILAFASFVERQSKNWIEDIANYRELMTKLDETFYGHLLNDERREIQETLRTLPQNEVYEFLQAMRAYFYTTQFSNYLMGEMPDLNLRFKGSLHQLLRMSNMIFDALVDVVMGPRACLAIITDTVSPKVKMSCDVPVVELNSSTFTNPVVLESLAHEVSHLFLLDLATWYRTPEERLSGESREASQRRRLTEPRRQHLWASDDLLPESKRETMGEIRESFHLLEENIFFSQISQFVPEGEIDRFMEATSDFMEAELLGYGAPLEPDDEAEKKSFDRWLRSFMLRIVLSTQNLTADQPMTPATGEVGGNAEVEPQGSGSQATEVPQPDESMIESAIIRAALVKIFRVLVMRYDQLFEEEFDIVEFKERHLRPALRDLRRSLREGCVIGMSTAHLEDLLCGDWEVHQEQWDKFCSREVTDLRFLADRYAVNLVTNFHLALKAHLDAGLAEDYRGAGRFWSTMQDCFQQQWRGGSDHQGIEAIVASSLFIQHWLDRDQLADLRSSRPGAGLRPWKAHLQPLARHWANPEDPEIRLHFYQRGRLQPVSDADQKIWNGAIQRFLVRSLSMVPAWHRSLLDEIDRVLKEEVNGAGAAPDAEASGAPF